MRTEKRFRRTVKSLVVIAIAVSASAVIGGN